MISKPALKNFDRSIILPSSFFFLLFFSHVGFWRLFSGAHFPSKLSTTLMCFVDGRPMCVGCMVVSLQLPSIWYGHLVARWPLSVVFNVQWFTWFVKLYYIMYWRSDWLMNYKGVPTNSKYCVLAVRIDFDFDCTINLHYVISSRAWPFREIAR